MTQPDRIDLLIERSSLGKPGVRRLAARAPQERVEDIVGRLHRTNRNLLPKPGHTSPQGRTTPRGPNVGIV